MWRVQDANGAKWLAFACLYTRHASPRRPLIAREGVLRHTILRSTVPKDWQHAMATGAFDLRLQRFNSHQFEHATC